MYVFEDVKQKKSLTFNMKLFLSEAVIYTLFLMFRLSALKVAYYKL
jgi:hypothetical protein